MRELLAAQRLLLVEDASSNQSLGESVLMELNVRRDHAVAATPTIPPFFQRCGRAGEHAL